MNKGMIILGIVTAGVVAAAVVTTNSRNEALEKRETTPDLLADIKDKLATVDRVEVQTPKDLITLVKKGGDKWGVDERGGYPADREKLQKIFVGIADLKPLEPKTTNEEWYSRLGVDDPSKSEDAKGTRITLRNGETETASLIIGNVKSGYGATQELYVRETNDKQAWLVRSPIAASGDITSWLEKQILDVQPNRIQSIEIDRWDDDDVLIARDTREQKDFQLKSLPEGAKTKIGGDIASLSRSMQNLVLEDVMPAAEAPDDRTSQTLITVQSFDGLRVKINLSTVGSSEYYATLDADYDASLRPTEESPAEGEDAPETEPLKPEADVQKEVADLNAKIQGWVYKIPQWKGTTLMKANSQFYTIPEPAPASDDTTTTGTLPVGN